MSAHFPVLRSCERATGRAAIRCVINVLLVLVFLLVGKQTHSATLDWFDPANEKGINGIKFPFGGGPTLTGMRATDLPEGLTDVKFRVFEDDTFFDDQRQLEDATENPPGTYVATTNLAFEDDGPFSNPEFYFKLNVPSRPDLQGTSRTLPTTSATKVEITGVLEVDEAQGQIGSFKIKGSGKLRPKLQRIDPPDPDIVATAFLRDAANVDTSLNIPGGWQIQMSSNSFVLTDDDPRKELEIDISVSSNNAVEAVDFVIVTEQHFDDGMGGVTSIERDVADAIRVINIPEPAISGLNAHGVRGDSQTSLLYYLSGEVAIDAPSGIELIAINIDSKGGIFTGDPAESLGGLSDNDADDNIFKSAFDSSFGSISFGRIAQAGLSEESIRNDLSVVGAVKGGGGLGHVDLIYVPEPSTFVMVLMSGMGIGLSMRRTQI